MVGRTRLQPELVIGLLNFLRQLILGLLFLLQPNIPCVWRFRGSGPSASIASQSAFGGPPPVPAVLFYAAFLLAVELFILYPLRF